MTAFITRFSARSLAERLRQGGACLLLAALLLLLPLLAHADAEIRYAEIVAADDGYVVSADIDMVLNPRLIDAVSRGVSLYFSAEFVVERPRWYWFDDTVVERRIDYRLSYHAITRSYRLSIGNLHQSFDTLDAALRTMLRIRHWYVAEQRKLEPGVSYSAALRMRLDTSLLPKPFQVTALGSRDWNLGTDWLRWTFLAGAAR